MKKLTTLILFALFFALSLSAQKHEKLTPLLTDLSGYDADKADGMSLDMGESSMISASRDYRSGDKEVSATILIANQLMMNAKMQEFSYQSSDESVETKTVDGYKLTEFYNKKDKSYSLTVYFEGSKEQGGIFTLTAQNVDKSTGAGLARKFDWNKIGSVVKSLVN